MLKKDMEKRILKDLRKITVSSINWDYSALNILWLMSDEEIRKMLETHAQGCEGDDCFPMKELGSP